MKVTFWETNGAEMPLREEDAPVVEQLGCGLIRIEGKTGRGVKQGYIYTRDGVAFAKVNKNNNLGIVK